MQNTGLVFKMMTDTTNYSRGLKKAQSELGSFDAMMGKLGSRIAGAFTVAAVAQFSTEVIRVTSEFQKYEAVLTNTLGSQGMAAAKLEELSQFAAKTPFQINQLTGAFVKLANQGFTPTGEEMRKLGDLASATGKEFDQLAEAIIDAQTGEFERLKEFGIKAAKNGDMVKFTFKGITTEVKNTNGAIRDYILTLGDAEGVSGSMAAISDTLGGKVSNLSDAWEQFMLAIGNSKGPLKSVIGETTSLLNNLTSVINDVDMTALEKLGAFFNIGAYGMEQNAKNKIASSLALKLQNDVDSWQGPRIKVNTYEEQKKVNDEAVKTIGIYGRIAEKVKAYKEQLEAANSEKTIRFLRNKIELLEAEKDYYDSIGKSLQKMQSLQQQGKGMPQIKTQAPIIPMYARNTAGPMAMGTDAPSLYELQETATMAADLLSNFRDDILSTAAEGFGLQLAGDMGLSGFFNGILMLTADFAKQFGRLLISIGLAKISLEKLGISGIGAVIAGTALLVAAGAISGLLAKSGNMQGLATGTNYVPEDGPYYLHKGESVVPKKYNPAAGGAGTSSRVTVSGRISGRDIRLTQSKENWYNSRVTGS